MRLTEQRREILSVLRRMTDEAESGDPNALLPDAREIARECGRRHNASDWAHSKLREMSRSGLCGAAGLTKVKSRRWRITDAGRAALNAEE